MQKWELLMVIMKNTNTNENYNAIATAVDEYLSEKGDSLICKHVYLLRDADSIACSVCGDVAPIEQGDKHKINLMRSIIDKMLNIDKPTYSESELIVIKDSIDRNMKSLGH